VKQVYKATKGVVALKGSAKMALMSQFPWTEPRNSVQAMTCSANRERETGRASEWEQRVWSRMLRTRHVGIRHQNELSDHPMKALQEEYARQHHSRRSGEMKRCRMMID
jgi:hypothetical protein